MLLLSRSTAVFAGEVERWSVAWIPAIGWNLSFMLDGLGFMFAFLITGIGLLIITYAHSYLPTEDTLGKFYAYLLLFMGAMLGLVLADNLITLFVFWELTSVTSYLLIGFDHEKAEARASALKALLVTGLGGLLLLAGFLLVVRRLEHRRTPAAAGAILALASMSVYFLFGPGGMVSFGHAAFFGIGAYDCERRIVEITNGTSLP